MKKIIYKGKIREGAVGTLSTEDFEVIYDDELKYAYLNPFPEINYSDDSYRTSVNNSNSVNKYFELHDKSCINYLNQYNDYVKRGMIIADIGCGGGSLLDHISGICSQTIAIEPNQEYQKDLSRRGHKTFGSIDKAVVDYGNKVDFVVSNHVIEHVNDPNKFIAEIKKLLKPNGIGIIITPNYNDILLKLDFETFAPFFFRKVHPLYLTSESLQLILEKNDLKYLETKFIQEFGMANALNWIKLKKPIGNDPIDGINELADNLWKSYLVQTGQTKDFAIIFEK
jgi:2-polyprenyl-3-methyl-5-hydroxy-6-metoxy-1,4-benzoquinol methylase